MQVWRIAGHVGPRAGMASIVGAAALLVAAPNPRQAPADRCTGDSLGAIPFGSHAAE